MTTKAILPIKRYPAESPETIMPEAEGYPWVVWEEETSEYEGLFLPTYFATRSEATNYIKRFWDGTARLKLTREYKVR